jgi:transcriptional antiterminator NusG
VSQSYDEQPDPAVEAEPVVEPAETADAAPAAETDVTDDAPEADEADEAPELTPTAEVDETDEGSDDADLAAEAAQDAPAEDTPTVSDPLEEFREALRSKPGDWFVVHTYSGMENRVKANLENRITP